MYIHINSLHFNGKCSSLSQLHLLTAKKKRVPLFTFTKTHNYISRKSKIVLSQTHDVSKLVTQLLNNRFTRPHNNLSKNSYHLFQIKNLHAFTKFTFTFYVIMVGSFITFVPESDCLKHHIYWQYLIQAYY